LADWKILFSTKKKTGKDLQVAPNDQAKHHHTLPPLLLTFETDEIPPL